MYFDTFTHTIREPISDPYKSHVGSKNSLREEYTSLLFEAKKTEKSSLENVLFDFNFTLSNTTPQSDIHVWLEEVFSRFKNPGLEFSRPWVFKVSSLEQLSSEISYLFSFMAHTPLVPVYIKEDMLSNSIETNTHLVHSGINCVIQREDRGPRYKPFSSSLFTEGGDCDIHNFYTQETDVVNRSYAIIGITTENIPSAIDLAGVLPSLS